jgi:hypothetical protein
MLIGALVTFLVVILILYLINLLPIDGRAKQICRIIVIILGVISLLKYIAVFLASSKSPGRSPGLFGRSRALSGSPQRLEPVVHVFSDLVLGEAVALLQLAFELLAAALDHVQVVVGQLAPFFLGGALELLPVSFEPVPIHHCPSVCCDDALTDRSTGRSCNKRP